MLNMFFVDEFDRQLDERGRIILPSRIREKLMPCVYITRSPSEKCLHVYTVDEWQVMSDKLRALPTSTDEMAAAFVRLFFGKATECEIDKQGRITVSKRLMEYAELKKDIVLVGANTRMEIWDKDVWALYQNRLDDKLLVSGLNKFGFNI